MRVLQICPKPPYPKVDGGCAAMASMTEMLLLQGFKVKTLCMSTHKHPFRQSDIPERIIRMTDMEAIPVDTRIRPFQALVALLVSRSYNISRFFSNEFDNRLQELLKKESFQMIILESLYATPYLSTLRRRTKAKIVLRSHNVEFRIWQQLAANEAKPLKRTYLKQLAKSLKEYEMRTVAQMDGLVTMTEDDRSGFGQLDMTIPMTAIPIGIDIQNTVTETLHTSNMKLYHLGAMDWQPNVEGIDWFLSSIWPKIEHELPEVECFLAGRRMPERFLAKSAGRLHVSGQVDSVEEFAKGRQIAIVPLLSGSGIRVKIIEALALGKVVITTTIGATGIPYTEGQNLLIADTDEAFVTKLRWLYERPSRMVEICIAARQLALQNFDLHLLGTELTYFYENKL